MSEALDDPCDVLQVENLNLEEDRQPESHGLIDQNIIVDRYCDS